ncbi:MAG: hypothetical protein CBC38_04100 [Gammaproteobacteria bacterium TMED78]|mgnify:CR=1 FL=1|nr:MAG: hypothetical protein CBC38_04100 [Gammaproteobacteria bacterium TMED78]
MVKYIDMNKFTKVTLLISIYLIACSCSMVPKKINQRVNLDTYLLRAEIAREEQRYYESAEYYLNATLISDDPEIAAYTTELLRELNLYEMGLSSAQKWQLLTPNDPQVYQYLGFFKLFLGEKDRAIEDFIKLIERAEKVDETYVMIIDLLISELTEDEWISQINLLGQKINPASAGYYYGLARLAIQNSQLDLADEYFEKISALKPEWVEIKLLHAKTLFYNQQEEKALSITESLYFQYYDPEIKLEHIKLLITALKNEEADSLLSQIISEYPNFHEARRTLALFKLSLEDYDASRESFIILRSLNNYKEESNYFLARIAENRENILEAMRFYSRVTSGQYAVESQFRVADILLEMLNDTDGAITHLSEFGASNPSYTNEMLKKKINILFLISNYEEAFSEISHALSLDSNSKKLKLLHIDLYLAVSQEHIKNKKYDDAEKTLNEGLETYNEDISLSYSLANLYQENGDYKKSYNAYEYLLNKNPNNPNILNATGYLLTNKLNDHKQALVYIEEALIAEPNNPAFLDSMGWVLFNLGDYEEALPYLEKAYSLLPDPEVSAHLVIAYWRNGFQEKALELLDRELIKNPENQDLEKIKNTILK